MATRPHIDYSNYYVVQTRLSYRPDWKKIFALGVAVLICVGFWAGFVRLLWEAV